MKSLSQVLYWLGIASTLLALSYILETKAVGKSGS